MEQLEQTRVELNQDELRDVTGGDNQTGAIVGSTVGGATLLAGTGVYATHKIVGEIHNMNQTLGHLPQKMSNLIGGVEGIRGIRR